MIASIGPYRHDRHNLDDSDLPLALVDDAGIVQRGGLDAGGVSRSTPGTPGAAASGRRREYPARRLRAGPADRSAPPDFSLSGPKPVHPEPVGAAHRVRP